MKRLPSPDEILRVGGGRATFGGSSASGSRRTFSGLAAPVNVMTSDGRRSVIVPGAFAKTMQEARLNGRDAGRAVKLLAHHDPHRLVGVVTSAKETSRGLEVVGTFAESREGDDMLALCRAGAADLSIGFDVLRHEDVSASQLPKRGVKDPATLLAALDQPQEPVRLIRELRLWEVSIVAFGALPGAEVESAAEAAARKVAEMERWAQLHALDEVLAAEAELLKMTTAVRQ